VPGDHGAHGSFDQRARNRSWEFLAESHVKTLGVALGVGVGAREECHARATTT
jgi:hypothetical protein